MAHQIIEVGDITYRSRKIHKKSRNKWEKWEKREKKVLFLLADAWCVMMTNDDRVSGLLHCDDITVEWRISQFIVILPEYSKSSLDLANGSHRLQCIMNSTLRDIASQWACNIFRGWWCSNHVHNSSGKSPGGYEVYMDLHSTCSLVSLSRSFNMTFAWLFLYFAKSNSSHPFVDLIFLLILSIHVTLIVTNTKYCNQDKYIVTRD